MAVKNSVAALAASQLAFGSISGTYALLGTLSNACFMIRIINTTDEAVQISYNGSTLNDVVPSGKVAELNFQTNSQPNTSIANMAAGTQVWVGGATGTEGAVYLCGYYSPQAASK
jgi:hypothetical protein